MFLGDGTGRDPEDPLQLLLRQLPELLAEDEIDDEVDAGVTDEGEVVEAGETEEPVWRDEVLRPTLQEVAGHHDLVAVEDDPGDVTETEHEDDADDDQGAVDLTDDIDPAAAVGVSRNDTLVGVKTCVL